MSSKSIVSPKQTVLQRLSNLLFGREEERRYGGVVNQEAQEGQNLISEALRILQPSVSLYHRLNFIKEFCEYIRSYRIESVAVFYAPLADLLDESKNHPIEAYEIGFQFMTALIEGQYAHLAPHRAVLFGMICDSEVKALWKYRALTALTNNGRDISPFEVELPNLLIKWLIRFASVIASRPDYYESDSESDTDSDSSDYYPQTDEKELTALSEVLQLGTNVMKYNQSHIDENARHILVVKVCNICDTATNVDLILACLNFIDAVVRYGRVPAQTVDILISTICRAVNIEAVCEASCKTMNNLLLSCGHSGVMALCDMLGNPKNKHAVNLLRGSVFFLGMANWGSQRIQTLDVPPSAILASFLHALVWKQEIVAYEVILAVRRLVTKYGPDLSMEWDLVFLVLDKIHAVVQSHENNLFNMLKETVINIEELAATNKFKGVMSKLEHLSVAFVPFKKETDVLRTIGIMFEDIHPSSPNWPLNLQHAVEVFFVRDKRTKVRRMVLAALKRLYDSYRALCGDELIERIFLQFLSNIYKDPDMAIRMEALDVIAGVAKGVQSDIFFRLVDFFDKAISTRTSPTDETSTRALSGLLSIFKAKLGHVPTSHPLGVWTVVARHAADDDVNTRKTVLLFMGALRATNGHHVMYNRVVSPFLRTVRVYLPAVTNLPTRATDAGIFPINYMVDVLLSRLVSEPVAELYGIVLDTLFGLLRDRYMMADAISSVSKLCDSICKLLNDRTLGACVQDYQRDDVRRDSQWILSYEIIGLICGYANPLDDLTHKIVMDTLVAGLFLRPPCGAEARLRIPRVCLGVLSMCATLLPTKHYFKYLPGILSALSQMSGSSKKNAYPAMEYLGVLVALPQLTGSLSPPEYESIFRCLLLFIDQGKQQSHVVAMAYRNLVLWFTACDLSFRYSYYTLITRSIESIVKDKDGSIGHVVLELLERYVYSDIDPVPSPTKSTSAVFDAAKSKTWVQGNSFITVRTGRMGWAEIVMRRPSGCVCWVQQFNFKAPLISDCFSADLRVTSPTSSLLFPTCVSPTLINSVHGNKTMDRDPFIPISPPTTSPPVSPTESRQRPVWDKEKRPDSSERIKRISRPSPRMISRSDGAAATLELEYNLATCIPRGGSPACEPSAIIPNPDEACSMRISMSPVTVSARNSPLGRQLSLSDTTPESGSNFADPEIDLTTPSMSMLDDRAITPPAELTLPESSLPEIALPEIASEATLPETEISPETNLPETVPEITPQETPEISLLGLSLPETVVPDPGPITPPPMITLSESEADAENETVVPSHTSYSEVSASLTPELPFNLGRLSPDIATITSPPRFLARTTASLALPNVPMDGEDEVAGKISVVETRGERDRSHSVERVESKRRIELLGRRRSSINIELPELQQGNSALKLSLFYPPLPSYDENELESPSFFSSTTDGRPKLDLETQLLLHYGNSPTSNPPTALNTLGFLSPSKRGSSERAIEPGNPNYTPRLSIPDLDGGLPNLGVSPREYSRLFPPLSPNVGKSQLSTSAHIPRDTSFDLSLSTSGGAGEPHLDMMADTPLDASVDGHPNASSESVGRRDSDASVHPDDDSWEDSGLDKSEMMAALGLDPPPDPYKRHSIDGSIPDTSIPIFDLDLSKRKSISETSHTWKYAKQKSPVLNPSDSSVAPITSTAIPISVPSLEPSMSSIPISIPPPFSSVSVAEPEEAKLASLSSTISSIAASIPASVPSPSLPIPMISGRAPVTSFSHEEIPVSHSLSRLLMGIEKHNSSSSGENSPLTSPQQARSSARRIVNFLEHQPVLKPRRLVSSPDNVPTMSRSASEPNIYLASPAKSDSASPAQSQSQAPSPRTSTVVPALPLRSAQGEGAGDVSDWSFDHSNPRAQSAASSPVNNVKGIVTRLRNNSVHFGTIPNKRSPRLYSPIPHVTSPSSFTSPSSALANPSSLIPAPSSHSNNNSHHMTPPHSPKPKVEYKDVLDPGFVFFHLRQMSYEKAKILRINDGVERAFNILDRIHIAETHKIGIMYVAPNQITETEILGNTSGSPRYSEFLRMMGKQVRLSSAGASDIYTGGLDRSGTTDGKYFVFWEDRVTQVVYHVTTLMPNLENEPLFNNKKRHIGNDFVSIVYSDSPDYRQQVVLGSFNFVQITIYPLTPTHYRVEVMRRLDLPLFGPIIRTAILDHKSLVPFVRTTAINANILSIMQQDSKTEYVSNLEVRVKQIKTIKERFCKDTPET